MSDMIETIMGKRTTLAAEELLNRHQNQTPTAMNHPLANWFPPELHPYVLPALADLPQDAIGQTPHGQPTLTEKGWDTFLAIMIQHHPEDADILRQSWMDIQNAFHSYAVRNN